MLDIKDPANPKRVDAVNDPNYSYWHSAAFSNDGKKVVFTDEWGGGLGARCRANDPNIWGANAIFNLTNNKLSFASYYKMPAAQGDSENCVAHNGSLIPVPGRDIKVQAWYQGGISIMDFTDASRPVEIGLFRSRTDRSEDAHPRRLLVGLLVQRSHLLVGNRARPRRLRADADAESLTQNEIDAAKTVRVAELNVQNQQRIEYPRQLVVAKAYIDQLERSQALPADQIAALREEIQKAESSKSLKKLKKLASPLEKDARRQERCGLSPDASRWRQF